MIPFNSAIERTGFFGYDTCSANAFLSNQPLSGASSFFDMYLMNKLISLIKPKRGSSGSRKGVDMAKTPSTSNLVLINRDKIPPIDNPIKKIRSEEFFKILYPSSTESIQSWYRERIISSGLVACPFNLT